MKDAPSFHGNVIIPILASLNEFSNENAFVINNIFYSYKDLGKCISKIRICLHGKYSDQETVGLVANDDLETYASIFALWLDGKAYVPLHPNQPFERSFQIIQQTNIDVVLDSSLQSSFKDYSLIETSLAIYTKTYLECNVDIKDDKLAYILFTSGSTGTPKGVKITRGNISAFIDSFEDTDIILSQKDRCLQCFDLTFDVSVESFLAPLLKGASVYTVPHNEIKYLYVAGLLDDHKLTFGAVAPSMLRFLKRYFHEINLPFMNCCIVTAEASSVELITKWRECIPNADIYNFYGPTEATIYCTYYKVPAVGHIAELNGMLSVGTPMKNIEAIVIDDDKKIVARGEKGELCLEGSQLTTGYWEAPEKNAASFFEIEHNGSLKRFYHTGDLCYLDGDGLIMLYGRLDSQVKIQGYRVELGEIEHHTRNFLNGNNAVALPFTNDIENTELYLFCEQNDGDSSALIDYLKSKLPFYMIPHKVYYRSEFPLNVNSKVDKLKLRKMFTNENS